MSVNGVAREINAVTDQVVVGVRKFLRRPGEEAIDPNLSAFIKNLPQDGFVDLGEFLHIQPKIRHWNENIDSGNKITLSHMMAVAARVVATLTLGRVFCALGASYHFVAGSSKLLLAAVECRWETNEKTTAIFKNAIHHFLLAVYNAVASLAYANYAIAVIYAFSPQWVEDQHAYFAGTEEPLELKKRQIIDTKRRELEALNCPSLARATGACIDVAGPYGEDGTPVEMPNDRKKTSIIDQYAGELSGKWVGHFEKFK